jgi:glycosyltransferase involved in cell wall biosynthesis
VIVPACDNAATIARALESLRVQARLAEIIVVDDGSSDDTALRARAWATEHDMPLAVVRQPNAGPSAARNAGARAASGDYLVFLDADDRLLPDALDRFAGGIVANDFPDMLIGGRIDSMPDGHRRTRRRRELSTHAETNFVRYVTRRDPPIGPGAAAIRRSVFDAGFGFPEALRVAEDSVFYAQLLATRRCAAIPEPVVEIGIDERRQTERLRRNADALLSSGEVLFDPTILPASFLRYRRLHEGRIQLSLFRAHHRAGARDKAFAAWRAALPLVPGRALRWTYLRKLLLGGGAT